VNRHLRPTNPFFPPPEAPPASPPYQAPPLFPLFEPDCFAGVSPRLSWRARGPEYRDLRWQTNAVCSK
jgi:hypothetical protein